MSRVTIYHNPRCSKSRKTLELIQQHGITPAVVLYLETPPDAAALKRLLAQLGMSPRDLIRQSEDEYRDQNLADPALSDESLIAAMCATPRLIERPIVVQGGRAVIGRPPERVLTLLADTCG